MNKTLTASLLALAAAVSVAHADNACEVTASLDILCLDAQVTCILDANVHVCLSVTGELPCLKDLAGHILWLPGQLTCKSGGDIITKPTIPNVPACEVEVDGALLCLDGQAQCGFGAEIYLCTSGGVTIPPNPTPTPPLPPIVIPPITTGGAVDGNTSTGTPTGTDPTDTGDDVWATGGSCSASNKSGGVVVLFALGAVLGRRRRRNVAALGMIAAAAGTAGADTIDADLLRSNTLGQGGVVVSNTDTLDAYTLRASALSDYANDPIELRSSEGRVAGVVDHLTTMDLRASMGLPAGFQVSVMAPMVLDRTGEAGLRSNGAGDVGVEAKWATRRGLVGFALATEATAPTGSHSSFESDGAWTVAPAAMVDVQVGSLRLGAMGGADLRSHEEAYMQATIKNQVHWGAIADWKVNAAADLHLIAETHGAIDIGVTNTGNPAETLGEIRWDMGDWMATAGAGFGMSSAIGVPDWRAFAGLAYTIGSAKHDDRRMHIQADVPAPAAMPALVPQPEAPAPVAPAEVAVAPVEVSEGPVEKPHYVFETDKPLVFHDIHFATAKYRILPDSFSILDDLADSLRKQPTVHIRIEGHTDGRGTEESNLTLSQQRALATMNYLIAAGIDPSRLDYIGFGKSRPVASNTTDSGMAENRRVEIRTTAK